MKKPMDYTHDYEMAKMSGAAYATPEQIRLSMLEKEEGKRLLPDGWKVEKYYEDKNTGFAAYAFINDKDEKIAISYRGSEPSYWGLDFRKPDIAIAHDGDTNLLRGVLGKHPREQVSGMMNKLLPDWDEQFTRGLEVAGVVLQRYGEAYKVYVTGHSLGGSIAQVSSEMFRIPGRTFDPGGAVSIVKSDEFARWAKNNSNQNEMFVRGGGDIPHGKHYDLVNYLVNDSIVSRHSGEHIGDTEDITGFGGRDEKTQTQYKLKNLPLPLNSIIDIYDKAELHSIDRIIKVFKEARDVGILNRVGVVTPEQSFDSSLQATAQSSPSLSKPGANNNETPEVETLKKTSQLEHPGSAAHPFHGLYSQAAAFVNKEDQRLGRTPDEKSERLALAATALAAENGITKIDHLVFSAENKARGVKAGENVFVAQGGLNDPAHDRAHMKTDVALNMPAEQSLRQMDEMYQRQTQETRLAQQQTQSQTSEAPTLRGPSFG